MWDQVLAAQLPACPMCMPNVPRQPQTRDSESVFGNQSSFKIYVAEQDEVSKSAG